MLQLLLGLALLAIGFLLQALCRRLRESDAAAQETPLALRELAARPELGADRPVTVRGPVQAAQESKTPLAGLTAAYFESCVRTQAGKVAFSARGGHPFLQEAGQRLWLEVESFGNSAELLPVVMGAALPSTPLYEAARAHAACTPDTAREGYQVLEGRLPQGQELLARGFIRRQNGRLTLTGGRGCFLTYRGQAPAAPHPWRRKALLLLGAAALIAGAVLLVYQLLA